MSDDKTPPAQHTPVHLRGDVFDPKHPAASAFATEQPGAGVVADDADELGQNDAGGEKASDAESTYADQKEVLEQRHEDALQAAVAPAPEVKAEQADTKDTKAAADDKTKPADKPATSPKK
jgi:hypothetical protein